MAPHESGFLFVYGAPEVVERVAVLARVALAARWQRAAADPGVQAVAAHAHELARRGHADGAPLLEDLAAWCRGLPRNVNDVVYAGSSCRARVRSEHSYVLSVPVGSGGDAPEAPLLRTAAALSALLQAVSEGDAAAGTTPPQLVAACAALRARYAAEYGSPAPWRGTTRVVTYGLKLGAHRVAQREAAAAATSGCPPAAPPPLAYLALVEPWRTDIAVFGARKGEPLCRPDEADGPSCLAGSGGQFEPGRDASLWECALREAEEETAVDLRPLLAGCPPPVPPEALVELPNGSRGLAYGAEHGKLGHGRFWVRLPDDVVAVLSDDGETVVLASPSAAAAATAGR